MTIQGQSVPKYFCPKWFGVTGLTSDDKIMILEYLFSTERTPVKTNKQTKGGYYNKILTMVVNFVILRLWSHRSIRYTVLAIRYTICSPPQTTFKWCSVEGATSSLWWRPNRIANIVYCILLCDPGLKNCSYFNGTQNVTVNFFWVDAQFIPLYCFIDHCVIFWKGQKSCKNLKKQKQKIFMHKYIQTFTSMNILNFFGWACGSQFDCNLAE